MTAAPPKYSRELLRKMTRHVIAVAGPEADELLARMRERTGLPGVAIVAEIHRLAGPDESMVPEAVFFEPGVFA